MSNDDIDTFVSFLFKPKVSFYIFLISLVVYLILLDDEGAFKNNFLKFGPDPNTKFLGMAMNTWEKVMLVYFISFFSSLLQTYSSTAMFNFIYLKIWNPSYKKKNKFVKNVGANNNIGRTFAVLGIRSTSIFCKHDNAIAIFDSTIFRTSFNIHSVWVVKSRSKI